MSGIRKEKQVAVVSMHVAANEPEREGFGRRVAEEALVMLSIRYFNIPNSKTFVIVEIIIGSPKFYHLKA